MKKAALLLGVVVISSMLLGCSASRNPIDADTFRTKAEEAGYTVIDTINPDGTAGDCLLAIKNPEGIEYQIEFVIVPTVEQAKSIYQEKKDEYESKKGTSSSHSSVSFGNYSYYNLTTNGKYYLVSRTANTFVFVEASTKYKDEISDFIRSIGY